MPRKPPPFNNPFDAVKLPSPPGPAAKAPPPVARPAARSVVLGDEDLWALAVEGADPLRDRSGRVRPAPAPRSISHQPLDPDLQAYDELRAVVTGERPFDISDSDEFIEGATQGLDPRVIKRLRRGDFSVQGHLDLHGMLKDEAKLVLETFIAGARRGGKRCVLIVHGRGLHSKDQVPVLKDAMKRWMGTARFAQHVLAFATARPHDGGAGAVYVLLRRT